MTLVELQAEFIVACAQFDVFLERLRAELENQP